jgi:prepilin-type N-terminal cleavage/methylation domain-containing protein/prepilin-type processing-associated H-X9-DG protein
MKIVQQPGKGFSLVELLVVVAVIAVLAALLLSAISNGKAKARSAVCRNNLHQISVAHLIAVDDNQGAFGVMLSPFEALERSDLQRWTYLDNFWRNNWGLRENGWICPAAPPRPKIPPPNTPDHFFQLGGIDFANTIRGDSFTREFSYLFNAAFDARAVKEFSESNNFDPTFLKAFNVEGDVQNPSQTPVWGDGLYDEAFFLASQGPPWAITPDHAVDIDFRLPRHGSRPRGIAPNELFPANEKLPGATNLSFADGHVEQTPLERLWHQTWHRDYVPPVKRPGL